MSTGKSYTIEDVRRRIALDEDDLEYFRENGPASEFQAMDIRIRAMKFYVARFDAPSVFADQVDAERRRQNLEWAADTMEHGR